MPLDMNKDNDEVDEMELLLNDIKNEYKANKGQLCNCINAHRDPMHYHCFVHSTEHKFSFDSSETLGICTGAILSDYQRLRVEYVCKNLNMQPVGYLWQSKEENILSLLNIHRIDARIIKIASYMLNPLKHIGKPVAYVDNLENSELSESVTEGIHPHLHYSNNIEYTNCNELDFDLLFPNSTSGTLVEYLIYTGKKHMHLAGEGGEYETLVVDCPLFKYHRIKLTDMSIVDEKGSQCTPATYIKYSDKPYYLKFNTEVVLKSHKEIVATETYYKQSLQCIKNNFIDKYRPYAVSSKMRMEDKICHVPYYLKHLATSRSENVDSTKVVNNNSVFNNESVKSYVRSIKYLNILSLPIMFASKCQELYNLIFPEIKLKKNVKVDISSTELEIFAILNPGFQLFTLLIYFICQLNNISVETMLKDSISISKHKKFILSYKSYHSVLFLLVHIPCMSLYTTISKIYQWIFNISPPAFSVVCDTKKLESDLQLRNKLKMNYIHNIETLRIDQFSIHKLIFIDFYFIVPHTQPVLSLDNAYESIYRQINNHKFYELIKIYLYTHAIETVSIATYNHLLSTDALYLLQQDLESSKKISAHMYELNTVYMDSLHVFSVGTWSLPCHSYSQCVSICFNSIDMDMKCDNRSNRNIYISGQLPLIPELGVLPSDIALLSINNTDVKYMASLILFQINETLNKFISINSFSILHITDIQLYYVDTIVSQENIIDAIDSIFSVSIISTTKF